MSRSPWVSTNVDEMNSRIVASCPRGRLRGVTLYCSRAGWRSARSAFWGSDGARDPTDRGSRASALSLTGAGGNDAAAGLGVGAGAGGNDAAAGLGAGVGADGCSTGVAGAGAEAGAGAAVRAGDAGIGTVGAGVAIGAEATGAVSGKAVVGFGVGITGAATGAVTGEIVMGCVLGGEVGDAAALEAGGERGWTGGRTAAGMVAGVGDDACAEAGAGDGAVGVFVGLGVLAKGGAGFGI